MRTIVAVIVMMCLGACAQPRHDIMAFSALDASATPTPQLISRQNRPLFPIPAGAKREKLDAELAAARADLAADPNNPEKIVWVGRRLGYLWRMNEAIAVYMAGIRLHPNYAPLYRHRGHRYISVRQFDKAIADLTRAAELIRGNPDEIEPDGTPNERNLPLNSLAFNVWYHLGVANYMKGDFEAALRAFRENMNYTRGYDDNVASVTDWTYMTLRRLGREQEALAALEPIGTDMDIIENHAYHRRTLMYKGIIAPDDLIDTPDASTVDFATLAYGLGNWYLCDGQLDQAAEVFERIVAADAWPAFGYIGAEVDLTRLPRH